jgi:hypothetical protein
MILTDPIPPWVPHWTSGAIIITAPAITWGPASAFIVIIMSGLALSGANLRRPVTLVVERRLLVAFLPTLGWAAGIVVRIWDLQRVIVPLTYFIEKPFRNWTDKNTDPLGSVILHEGKLWDQGCRPAGHRRTGKHGRAARFGERAQCQPAGICGARCGKS